MSLSNCAWNCAICWCCRYREKKRRTNSEIPTAFWKHHAAAWSIPDGLLYKATWHFSCKSERSVKLFQLTIFSIASQAWLPESQVLTILWHTASWIFEMEAMIFSNNPTMEPRTVKGIFLKRSMIRFVFLQLKASSQQRWFFSASWTTLINMSLGISMPGWLSESASWDWCFFIETV